MARADLDAFPSEHSIRVEGVEVPVRVRKHPTARRLTLRVSHTRRAVIVTVPRTASLGEAGRFVGKHLDWVNERLEALPDQVPFAQGMIIPYRGHEHIIRFAGPSRGQRVAWTEGMRAAQKAVRDADEAGLSPSRRKPLDLYLPKLFVTGHEEHSPRRLKDWLVGRAREEIGTAVAVHCGRLGLKARRLVVRDQSSRWGSCSSARVLSFSWRLIMAPPFVLDYVAAHEVAHLKEMNHGGRFWRLLGQTYPEVDDARRWLLQHGAALHSYGAAED